MVLPPSKRDDDAGVGALHALEPGAELERDAAAAECTLEQLRTRLVFER